jgi:hypothetical protein
MERLRGELSVVVNTLTMLSESAVLIGESALTCERGSL